MKIDPNDKSTWPKEIQHWPFIPEVGKPLTYHIPVDDPRSPDIFEGTHTMVVSGITLTRSGIGNISFIENTWGWSFNKYEWDLGYTFERSTSCK